MSGATGSRINRAGRLDVQMTTLRRGPSTSRLISPIVRCQFLRCWDCLPASHGWSWAVARLAAYQHLVPS
jgi:hypothetical protein